MGQQKDRVREVFTEQADSYANSVTIAADSARRDFIEFIGTNKNDRVLDVATGPGFLALLFAKKAASVVGVDLTPAMIERAEATRIKREIANVCFQVGDAESILFPDESFDIVTCGSAFHHFPDPTKILAEMRRVTRNKGKVALLDIITSENIEQATLHNQLEQWRDPTHTRNLTLTELVALFKKSSIKNICTHTYNTPRELDEWFAISHTYGSLADKIREAFIESIPKNTTGLNVHLEGERICFTHTFAWVVGTRT